LILKSHGESSNFELPQLPMKVVPFIAENAAAALAQIHQQLGPDAVVVSVRPLPAQGLARFWQKNSSVEVLACVAEYGDGPGPATAKNDPRAVESILSPDWLLGKTPLAPTLHDGSGRPHIFIGPPGVGKTTLLCKWMTLSVLNQNRTAQVWRLDGAGANSAEFLNVYGEMLGVPVERFWGRVPATAEFLLVDYPGVQPDDSEALRGLQELLAALPSPRVHLVLNAAYETTILSYQFRAFAAFQPEDISFCHLDEEKRQGKLLDLVLGTNCCVRFLSNGQKIPGDLVLADTARCESAGFAR
jgi:flagellar biosynthesis GTPase FlhF